jgi:hypothetical protein
LDQIARFAGGDNDQELPEVAAVMKLGEAALFGGATEAVEGTQGHIFLVGRAPGRALELFACQSDQALEIALPEGLGGGLIAGLELADPVRDRSGG